MFPAQGEGTSAIKKVKKLHHFFRKTDVRSLFRIAIRWYSNLSGKILDNRPIGQGVFGKVPKNNSLATQSIEKLFEPRAILWSGYRVVCRSGLDVLLKQRRTESEGFSHVSDNDDVIEIGADKIKKASEGLSREK